MRELMEKLMERFSGQMMRVSMRFHIAVVSLHRNYAMEKAKQVSRIVQLATVSVSNAVEYHFALVIQSSADRITCPSHERQKRFFFHKESRHARLLLNNTPKMRERPEEPLSERKETRNHSSRFSFRLKILLITSQSNLPLPNNFVLTSFKLFSVYFTIWCFLLRVFWLAIHANWRSRLNVIEKAICYDYDWRPNDCYADTRVARCRKLCTTNWILIATNWLNCSHHPQASSNVS